MPGKNDMITELRHRFIKTTMLVVTILLVAFLAVLNCVNFALSGRDSRITLNRVMEREMDQIRSEGRSAGALAPQVLEGEGAPRTPYEEGGSLGIYFTARVNENGAIIHSDLSHAGDLTWDDMVELLQKADDSFGIEVSGETEQEEPPAKPEEGTRVPEEGIKDPDGSLLWDAKRSEAGRTGSYMYQAAQYEDGSATYAFLDISRETSAMVRILVVTIVVGVGTWFLVLLLVVYLSRRAIAPIAENIKRQRQFITDAGHELKTPLAVILSNVDVQELHGGKSKWLDNIRSQTLRLSDLTKQMLVLSKMDESGSSSFASMTFDASAVMQDTVRIFRESASLRGMQINTEIDPGIQITFSKEQYQQMLELLMDNAVKYGKEDGEISVSMHANRKTVRMTFRNKCEELPDIEPNRLFDRFYRADTSRSRQTGGSGIGLAVVRAIAENSGGKANVYFRPDNVIEFVIEIPRN